MVEGLLGSFKRRIEDGGSVHLMLVDRDGPVGDVSRKWIDSRVDREPKVEERRGARE